VAFSSPFGHIHTVFNLKVEGKQHRCIKVVQYSGYFLWEDGKCTDYQTLLEDAMS
jgi:hypothetical protein